MRPLYLLSALALGGLLHAEIKLPAILTEHMVLQRGLPVHIWGKATAGEHVTVTFRSASSMATADPLGKWSVSLPPGEAGGPFDLTIKGDNPISFNDVLVGDVWVASGQSNMEWQLRRTDTAEAEMAVANFPKIRRAKVARKVADFPMDDAAVEPWSSITPQTAGGASAVAYFFAKHLQPKLDGVPIGIIESFWGGTPVEAWMSLRSIGQDPALMPIFANWARAVEAFPAATAAYERRLATWTDDSAKAKGAGMPEPPRPPAVTSGPGGPNTPTGLYNGMIAPIVPYPIKGAIWYQGESNANANQVGVYARAFQTMIRDWRHAWNVGDFPFLWVQLPNYKTNGYWPDLREAQTQTLALANTGMAVGIDVGIAAILHPPNKVEIGTRLAIAARGMVYGEKIEYSGPMFRTAAREGAEMRVWFDHAGGLTAKGGSLKGFEVAGRDRKFMPAEGRIDGTSVVLGNASITEPVYVRYAWADAPECNLYNAADLPASPFRSAQ